MRDNTILLNRGETAAGVSKGFARIEIDRGTLPKFQILFDESDRRFKTGEEGDLWCLALRDDDADMLNGMFTSWDSSTKRLKTTNIIPSDRKLAFTDNNSYLQLISHSFSGDALSQTLRYSNSLGGIFISAGNTNLNLDTDKTGFYFHKNILLPSTISSVSDFLFKRSDVTKLSLKDTVAQFTVPVTAITFNRASDGSEVLYHADLENTEFKNYIIIAGPNDIKLYLKSTDEDNYNLISSVDQDGNKLSNMGYYGSYWAIENNRIAVYKYDANGYPEIINQDGTSPGYLRACTSGFLPNVSGNLASGGNGYLGTSSWAFANAYIANNHSNKYYFGTNDVFLDASTTRISAKTTGAAIGMNVGSLLVSNDYSDGTKVPNNGIYSKGAIKSYTGFTSDFRISNLTIARTGNDVLHISSFTNYPENRPGIDPISSQAINDGVALTYFWQGDFALQLVGDIDGTGIAYRRYTPSTGASGTWKFLADTNWVSNKITSVAGNYLPLAGGTMTGSIIMSNNITIQSKDSNGNSKRLIGKGSDNVTYIGDSDGHTFLYSDAADIIHVRNGTNYTIYDSYNFNPGNYLPLTGGTLTGQLIINAASNSLIINNTSSGGNESFIKVKLNGTDKAAIGFLSGSGSYIHNYESSKYLFVKSDGAYFGTPSSNVKLLTTDDNVITAVGGENYVNVSLSKAAQASAGAVKYLEWWDSTPGWYNFITGYIIANGFIRATTSLQCDGQAILQYSHNGSYHNAINVNKLDGAGYVMIGNYTSKMRTFLLSNASDILHYRSTDGSSGTDYVMWDAYNLPNPATQSWVTNQNYYKSGSSYPLFTSGVTLAANASSGGWARTYWVGNNASDGATGVVFGGYGVADIPNYAYVGVGDNRTYNAVNNLKIYTDKVTFGNKTLATVDQIPTIPSISITTSGSGSVVTGISASGHTLTVTKGSASVSVSWNDITGKPSSFPPSAHTHEYIVGKYTGSGGVIAPGSIGTNKLQCNMMYVNAESSGGGYCDWILMNAYSWSDVPYATAIGVVKAATPSAYIMSGPNSTDKSTWVRKN